MNTKIRYLCGLLLVCVAVGCEPKVGSDAWCKKMDDKPKADWSANDVSAYTKNCIFKTHDHE